MLQSTHIRTYSDYNVIMIGIIHRMQTQPPPNPQKRQLTQLDSKPINKENSGCCLLL